MRSAFQLKDGRKTTYLSPGEFYKMYERHTDTELPANLKLSILASLFFHLLSVLTLGVMTIATIWFMCVVIFSMVSRIYSRHLAKITGYAIQYPTPWINRVQIILDIFSAFILIAIPAYTFTISGTNIMMKLIGTFTTYVALFAYYTLYTPFLVAMTQYAKLIYDKFGAYLGETASQFDRRMIKDGAVAIEVQEYSIDLTLNDVPAFDNPEASNDLVSPGELSAKAFRDYQRLKYQRRTLK